MKLVTVAYSCRITPHYFKNRNCWVCISIYLHVMMAEILIKFQKSKLCWPNSAQVFLSEQI